MLRSPPGRVGLIPLLLLALALAGCRDEASPPHQVGSSGYGLVETGRFGWGELSDSTRPMTDRERLFMGAVLGNPTSIVEGAAGEVYVLDAAFQKIVVFSAEGHFLRLIVGGRGRGPGEFEFPIGLTFGPGGDLWAFDMHLQRISRFSTDGRLIAILPVPSTITPRMMRLAATQELLYGVRHARDSIAMVVAFDSTGRVVGELNAPTSEDIRFGGPRLLAALGSGADGAIITAHTDVGTWSRIEGVSQGVRRGVSFFPDAVPWEHVDTLYGIRTTRVAAETSHAGAFPDGLTFLRFNEAGQGLASFRLALYDSAGALLAVLDSVGFGGAFGHSPRERVIYAVDNEPFPEVVRYRITRHD